MTNFAKTSHRTELASTHCLTVCFRSFPVSSYPPETRRSICSRSTSFLTNSSPWISLARHSSSSRSPVASASRATLEALQKAAATSIGLLRRSDERLAERISLDAFLALIETADDHLTRLLRELIMRAERLPQFERLTSLSGVGQRLAALFLAEVQDLSRFTHFKHIEKLAGLNLRLFDSGRYSGARHISSIGNSRLRWILYKMAEETARRVPEVRVKYLQRQLKRRKHVKNVIASIPQLLQLIMAMEKHQCCYEPRPNILNELKELETKYEERKAQRKPAA